MKNKKPIDGDVSINDTPQTDKKEWGDYLLFDLIKNGYNLYDISREYDVKFSYLVDLTRENPEEYAAAKQYYYVYLGELMETKTRNATTSIVTSYISLLKILKPEVYRNEGVDEINQIEFELQG